MMFTNLTQGSIMFPKMIGPLENFRKLNVIPNEEDLRADLTPRLPENITNRPYQNANTYLDIQFRLLREDFFYQLRSGIQKYKEKVKQKILGDQETLSATTAAEHVVGLYLYRDVKIRKDESGNDYFLQFSIEETKDVQWEESKRLIHGTLLCLSVDDFESILFFVVTQNNPDRGIVEARLEGGQIPSNYENLTYTMVETMSFFGAYRYVLEGLQCLRFQDLLLKDFILGRKYKCERPLYLAGPEKEPLYDFSSVSPGCDRRVKLSDPLLNEIPGLNTSQSEALREALTKQVALIQGPPGTGKTFLVSKIVQVLLDNRSYWSDRPPSPILILAYTNSALDQLLENILSFNRNIIRIGSQSKSEKLKPYLLYEILAQSGGQSLNKVKLCRRADIVSMTTSGASRNRRLIAKLAPKIVIVEEAALAPEAHIVVALPSSCQHLIMMGDHKQLKPVISSNHLAKEPWNLSVSFFERLINNGMKPSVLTLQYRMRPEISCLITPAIYPNLIDHDSVKEFPSIRGMNKNVFFLVHNNNEEIYSDGRSRLNPYEIEMALALARHLLLQGYEASQITILVTYLGQKITTLQSNKNDVAITTVDGFQGKENDIIILSLVRSNEDQCIGFLHSENRACVALSRAKMGFYLIGDMNALQMKSVLWAQIDRVFKSMGEIGDAFPLKCEIHGKITKVKCKKEFPGGGGCKQRCGKQLDCGHICKKKCHVTDQNHEDYQCLEKCTRLCLMKHPCEKKCHEECAPCLVKVMKNLPCEHARLMECHKEPSFEYCKKPCTRKCLLGHPCSKKCGETCPPCLKVIEKQLPCKHSKRMECSSDPSKEICVMKVKKQISCQHFVEVECHIEPSKEDCEELCSKFCPSGHPCAGKCNEECPPCAVEIPKTLRCGHSKIMECHRNPRKVVCNEPCAKFCPNQHPCPMKCKHSCKPCKVKIPKTLPCGHSKNIVCHKEPSKEVCQEPCSRTCPKGHKCPLTCGKKCRPCRQMIDKTLPCGHVRKMECSLDPSEQYCSVKSAQVYLCGHHEITECGSGSSGHQCEILDYFYFSEVFRNALLP